jgi:Glyoxalase/Bleomycin resistance protein/Dioxygenase superfamily
MVYFVGSVNSCNVGSVTVGSCLFRGPPWTFRSTRIAESEKSGRLQSVYVDDIDRHFQRAKEEDATIVSEPENMFWGGRSDHAIDPEGQRWEFLQIGRELAPEHWSLPAGITRDGQNAV